jgi:hypothetical protein
MALGVHCPLEAVQDGVSVIVVVEGGNVVR